MFDTINPEAKFSSKVRRLGDFCQSRKVDYILFCRGAFVGHKFFLSFQVEDIDDPLYGNMGGPDEVVSC